MAPILIDRFEIGKLNDSGTVEFVIPSLSLLAAVTAFDTHSEEGIPYDYQTGTSMRYRRNMTAIYKPKHEWKIK